MFAHIEGFRSSWAVAIGIDRYTDGVPQLRTPVSDATRLAEILEQHHGFKAQLVVNEEATLSKLRAHLCDLASRVGKDDRVLFYFAGHGIALESDEGPRGFLLPQDAARNSTDQYLPMVELSDTLSALPCRHMLVVLDCCFAGALRWASTRDLALAPESLHRERYAWYVQDAAWQAIASAAHDQRALDVAVGEALGERGRSAGHSPFATALMDGLAGAADIPRSDGTGDGVITATELFLYLEERLKPPAGSGRPRQTPILWPLPKHDKGQFVFRVPGKEPNLPSAPPLNEETNPWRGLKPYESTHADLFFGRRNASERLLEQVLQNRLVAVTGPSGIGKSSLVRAGLLPRLPDSFRPVVVRPGPTPFASLSMALHAAWSNAPDAERLRTNPSALAAFVAEQRTTPRDMLLVVDQAEELITMNRDADVTRQYLALLANALSAETRLRIVFTVRSEFEPQFAQSVLKDQWLSSRYLVPQMTQDELRRVVEGPAAVKVLRFESAELVDTLVNEVVQMPGALPLLSFALSEMYANYLRRPGDDRTLTREHYEGLEGGVTGSLRARANKVMSDFDEAHKPTARRVLERLVSVESGEFARRRVPRRELEASDADEAVRVSQVVKCLVDARLIVTDEVDQEPYLELAHDALIFGWDRLLAWIRNDLLRIVALRRLTPDAEAWSSKPKMNAGLLWDDATRSPILKDLINAPFPGLNRTERNFATASTRRARRNKQIRWAALGVLLLLSIGVASFGLLWREQRNEAVARLVASEGFRIASDDPNASLPYFLSSLAVKETPNAISGLVSVLNDDPHIAMRLLPLPSDLSSLAVRQSDNTALIGLKNGEVLLWPITPDASGAGESALGNAQPFVTLKGLQEPILAVGSSWDGSSVVALDKAGNVLRWSQPRSGQSAVNTEKFNMEEVASSYNDGSPYAVVSNDGSTIAVSTYLSGVRLWQSGRMTQIDVLNFAAGAIALSPDGKTLAVGLAGDESLTTAAILIDLSRSTQARTTIPMPGRNYGFGVSMGYAFEAAGAFLAGGTTESNLYVVDIANPNDVARVFRPFDAEMAAGGEIERVLLGRGAKYALALHRRSWHIWDVNTGVRIGKTLEDQIGIASLDATGERLILSQGPSLLHVVDLASKQLNHLACMKATKFLSESDWIGIVGNFPQPCICPEHQQCAP
ncbi:MAG: caspase family protein [Rhizobiaceae bacterium]